jgi:hypothetical protein
MLSLRRVVLTVVAVTLMGAPAVFAQNALYTYIAATDTSAASRFSDVAPPVIGGNGDVAFAASVRNGGSGVYKWSAATHQIVTIYEDLVDRLFDGTRFAFPAIDGAGRVFFQLDSAVMAGSGGGLITVADSSFTVPLGSNPGPYNCLEPRLVSRSASAAGRVLVSCQLQSGTAGGGAGRGVYLADGSGLSRICDVDTSNFFNIFPRCFLPGAEVASNGVVGGLSIGIIGSGAESGTWVPARGDAAGIEKLLDPAAATAFWPYAFLASPFAISQSGRLLYMAYQAGPTSTQSGYAITSIDTAFAPVHVTDPRNGVYRDAISPSINDLDEMAFADTVRHGLFTGPDPVIDRVLGQSDHLPGYSAPVVDVAFTHPGLNLTGSLTFLTFLGDGTIVVTVAQRFNRPPVITNPGNQSTPEGSAVTLHIEATDPENDVPLNYGLVIPAPPPNGTIGGLPPGINGIDANGDFSGTPAAGTSGNTYALTVRVTDSRGASSDMSFTWTITPAVPAARTQLIATANVAAQGIDLTWQNPAGDSATTIDVDISQTGPGGPYQNWQILPAGSTAFQFVISGSDPNFCFKVRGSSPAGIGPYSNFGCANYPQLIISHQAPFPNTTSVLIPLTTNMPATLSIPNPPAGSVVGINVLSPTSFQIAISNLSVATAYTVRVAGESDPVRREATHDVSFTTLAAPGGGGGGHQGHNAVAPGLRVSAGNLLAYSNSLMFLELRVSNDAVAPVAAQHISIGPATSVEWRCPAITNTCPAETIIEGVLPNPPVPEIATLEPGGSATLQLWFEFLPNRILTTGGRARFHLVMPYQYADGNSTVDATFLLDPSVFLPVGNVSPAGVGIDLGVRDFHANGVFGSSSEVDVSLVAENLGFGGEVASSSTVVVALPEKMFLPMNPADIFPWPLPAGVQCRASGLGAVEGANGFEHIVGSPPIVTCTVRNLGPGESRLIQFRARKSASVGTIVATIQNGGTLSDPHLENNIASTPVP